MTKLTRGGEEVKGALQHYLTSTLVLSGARSRNSEAPGGRSSSSSSSSRRRELAAEVGQEVVATPRRVVFLFFFEEHVEVVRVKEGTPSGSKHTPVASRFVFFLFFFKAAGAFR